VVLDAVQLMTCRLKAVQKNAAPKVPEKGTPASGGPSKGDCKRLDRIDRDFRDLYDRLDECGLR